MFFLSANHIMFTEKTVDPRYSATRPFINSTIRNKTVLSYTQDDPVSPLGCSYQVQYCSSMITSESHCTPLGAPDDMRKLAIEQTTDRHAQKTLNWSITTLYFGNNHPFSASAALGQQSLSSRRGLWNGRQGHLSDTHWQDDVQCWFNISLAALQRNFVTTAAGPPSSIKDSWNFIRPSNDEETKGCYNQVS